MERRNFLRVAFGVALGAAAITATAQAAPLAPQAIGEVARTPQGNPDAQPAVIGADEAAQMKPEQVRWHGGWHHHGWHHRHWGWHRHHWHHRHWRRW